MRMQHFPGVLCGAALVLAGATAPAMATGRPADHDIEYWVKSALRDDPHVNAPGILVAADKGMVTLHGTASNLATKQYAARDAEKINGVVGVIDRIDLAVGWRPDFDIAQDVRHRIINNGMIATSWITVTSSDGLVTLGGEVGSWAEKQEAGLVAAEVRGVQEVNNELTIRYLGDRSDTDIKKDARARLDLDTYLNALPITVSVKHGVVTLSGVVGSAFEKNRAEREVRYLANVKAVNNDLTIEPWEDEGARTATAEAPSDSQLTSRVNSMLERDRRVDTSKIDVDASHGHVTLTGSVPFMYEKRVAGQDATNTIGTAWVTNDLLVTGVRRQDDSIATDILSNFASDYLLSGLDIAIRVEDGTVTLTGNAGTAWERQHAEEIVTRVPGVRKIRNRIKVQQNHLSDGAVTKTVDKRLARNWITAPVHKDIDVTVKDGIVTLLGEVDTWAERAEAAQIALRTPGVWGVYNSLAVRGVPYPWEDQGEEILLLVPDGPIWP